MDINYIFSYLGILWREENEKLFVKCVKNIPTEQDKEEIISYFKKFKKGKKIVFEKSGFRKKGY